MQPSFNNIRIYYHSYGNISVLIQKNYDINRVVNYIKERFVMLTLKAYDDLEVSNFIELPRIEDMIINFPFCKTASIEDLYMNANDDLKYIISKVPLKNKHRHVTVNMEVQLLFLNRTTAPRSNWHLDGGTFIDEESTYTHILSSDCFSRTEFLGEEIILDEFTEQSQLSDVEIFINRNLHLIKSARKIEPQRFTTFKDKHMHRAVRSNGTEFRFFLRVHESNYLQPREYHDALLANTRVFDDKLYTSDDYANSISDDYIRNNNIDNNVSSIQRISNNQIILNLK